MMFRSFTIILVILFEVVYGVSAQAESPANIFKAETHNPDILKTIRTFEDVCLPFILHETLLTRNSDRELHGNIMARKGFSYSIPRGRGNTLKTDQFTVFNGVSEEVTKSTLKLSRQLDVVHKPYIEHWDPYISKTTPNLRASLTWSPDKSQKKPAKSCVIGLKGHSISKTSLVADVIRKDADWIGSPTSWNVFNGTELIDVPVDIKEPRHWTQCIHKYDEDFVFTIRHKKSDFSISVQRNFPFKQKCNLVAD